MRLELLRKSAPAGKPALALLILLLVGLGCSYPQYSGLPPTPRNSGALVASADQLSVSPSLFSVYDVDGDGRASAGDRLTFAVTVLNFSSLARVTIDEVTLTAKSQDAFCLGGSDLKVGEYTICTADDTLGADEVSSGSVNAGFAAHWKALVPGASDMVSSATISIPLSSLAAPTLRPTATPKHTLAATAGPTSGSASAKPGAGPSVPIYGSAFFGPGVKMQLYEVYGSSPYAIEDSIATQSPERTSAGQAEGETRASIDYRFDLRYDTAGNCNIVATANPAVAMAITVMLPHWTPPAGVSNATVSWVASEWTRVATHEKVHVTYDLAAAAQANRTLSASTCAGVENDLNKIWDQLRLENCQFDMEQYGKAQGLSLQGCLSGQW
jgi:predicted secreted Zn-dependent protease